MPNYTFSTLNDRDFELLTQDLLQAEFGVTLEGFKSGKDQGMDLRYTRGDENLIAQCKHYYKSGLNKLIRDLTNKKGEFVKAKKLNSTRYILVTSVELSPINKAKIFQESNGLIKEVTDIIGNEDLNNFLGKYPEIEKKHYKLWLSSTNILEKIFHNQVYQILNNPIIETSKNKIIEIQKKLPKLVKINQYNEAYKKLVDNKIIFITGEPGCDKSTISEMLFINFISQEYQGWFSSNLKEFKGVLNTGENKDKKEIFFWDDIFGHTYFHLERGFDTGLIQFIQSIKNSKHKYLIINSRTVILNRAKIESEKIKREKIFDINQYELEIINYSDAEKAVILYNHCIFNLENNYFDEIKKDEFYFKIINHRNFSPRLIEFITDPDKFQKIPSDSYKDWIIKQLDNPEDVWLKCFNDLSSWAKDYLKICYTFTEKKQELIDECFTKILLQKSYNNETDLIKSSIDELTNSFLNITLKNGEIFYTFFNPSIEDFLTSYFNRNQHELQEVLMIAIYLEQFGILDNSHLPFYKQDNSKLRPSENLRRISLEYIKKNKNELKTDNTPKDLLLYETISKLPVDDIYLQGIVVNNLLPNIEKASDPNISNILYKIAINEGGDFQTFFDEEKIGILSYNYICKQTDFYDIKSAVILIKYDILEDFYPNYSFFKEYQNDLESFFDEFCRNYEYQDYYFNDLQVKYSEVGDSEFFVDEDEYWETVSQIVDKIQEIADILEINCDITKDDISNWHSYEDISESKRPDGDTPDTDSGILNTETSQSKT
jgi:hypothetical protein